jgi:homoserine O-acetyltransferase
MQTFEWIVRYPNFMKKAVPIIGSPKLTTAGLLLWQAEMRAIEAAETCHCDRRKMMFAVQAMHRQLRAMMSQDVAANAGGSMQRAAASVKARTLVVIATQDHMVNPTPALHFAEGANAEVLKLTGNCGHMATGCESVKMTAAVRAFPAQ